MMMMKCVPLHFQITLVGREHTLLSNHEKNSHLLAFRAGGCEFLPSRAILPLWILQKEQPRFGARQCKHMMMN
jgi:hypothetical protein